MLIGVNVREIQAFREMQEEYFSLANGDGNHRGLLWAYASKFGDQAQILKVDEQLVEIGFVHIWKWRAGAWKVLWTSNWRHLDRTLPKTSGRLWCLTSAIYMRTSLFVMRLVTFHTLYDLELSEPVCQCGACAVMWRNGSACHRDHSPVFHDGYGMFWQSEVWEKL